jgi:hypothetical protein
MEPAKFRWRKVRLFTLERLTFPVSEFRDFGFGYCSHSGPVLKLDAGGTWHVLAHSVLEREVVELIHEINQRGYCFPPSSSGPQTSDGTPTFRTLT